MSSIIYQNSYFEIRKNYLYYTLSFNLIDKDFTHNSIFLQTIDGSADKILRVIELVFPIYLQEVQEAFNRIVLQYPCIVEAGGKILYLEDNSTNVEGKVSVCYKFTKLFGPETFDQYTLNKMFKESDVNIFVWDGRKYI
jgi:hypothetical protein